MTSSIITPQQLEYFRRRLLAWWDQLLQEPNESAPLQENLHFKSDVQKNTVNKMDQSLHRQSQDERQQKLLAKIDEALHRIEQGTYGRDNPCIV